MKKKIDLSSYDEKDLWMIRNLLKESADIQKIKGDQKNYKKICKFIIIINLEIEKRAAIRKQFISAQVLSKSLHTFVKSYVAQPI